MKRPAVNSIERIEKAGEIEQILNSKVLNELLSNHKEYLQKEVNRFLREQKNIEAYGALSKLDDVNKIIDLLRDKLEAIKKGE